MAKYPIVYYFYTINMLKMSSKEELSKPKAIILFMFMVVAGLMRALPMPPNFAPIGAMALFGGAYFVDRRMAYLLPLVAMLFSDLVLGITFPSRCKRAYSGFHEQMIGVYIGFLGTVFIGGFLRNRVGILTVGAASLGASVGFFLISNFNVWLLSSVDYSHDFAGLVNCYTMAISFLPQYRCGRPFLFGPDVRRL